MNDWCRQLGTSHRRRGRAIRLEACTLQDGDRERQNGWHRWPAIAAAMRTLVRDYNEGAGIEVLTLVDYASRESRDLIVEVVASGGQTLTMELDGAELYRAREQGHGRLARSTMADGGSRSASLTRSPLLTPSSTGMTTL